jgi:hypothetical protein
VNTAIRNVLKLLNEGMGLQHAVNLCASAFGVSRDALYVEINKLQESEGK